MVINSAIRPKHGDEWYNISDLTMTVSRTIQPKQVVFPTKSCDQEVRTLSRCFFFLLLYSGTGVSFFCSFNAHSVLILFFLFTRGVESFISANQFLYPRTCYVISKKLYFNFMVWRNYSHWIEFGKFSSQFYGEYFWLQYDFFYWLILNLIWKLL